MASAVVLPERFAPDHKRNLFRTNIINRLQTYITKQRTYYTGQECRRYANIAKNHRAAQVKDMASGANSRRNLNGMGTFSVPFISQYLLDPRP